MADVLAKLPVPVPAGRLTVRLTGRVCAALVAAVLLVAPGWCCGYPVLVTLGAVCAGRRRRRAGRRGAAASAWRSPGVFTRPGGTGRPALARLRVHNPGTRRQAGFTAVDRAARTG